mgnify:FL=1
MAYVVTGNCDACRFTDCVEVCPVNCFYGDEKMLYINPDECIDCAICVPACIVGAIVEERDVPRDQRPFIQLNAELSAAWPRLPKGKPPPPDAEEWDGVLNKRRLLER